MRKGGRRHLTTEPLKAECALCGTPTDRGAVIDRADETYPEPRGLFWICPSCVDEHDGDAIAVTAAIKAKRETQ